jgi:hypothetical protein
LIGIRRNIANVRLAISSAISTAAAMSMLGTALAVLLLMIYDALMRTASDRQLMADVWSGHRSFRQLSLESCVVQYGCYAMQYPWITIIGYANGTRQGSTGGY